MTPPRLKRGPGSPVRGAPASLLAMYARDRGLWYAPILERLLTDPRMEAVWRTLRKGLGKNLEAGAADLLHEVLDLPRMGIQRREAKRDGYRRIARAARRLSAAVRGTRYDDTPYRWYDDEAARKTLAHLRADDSTHDDPALKLWRALPAMPTLSELARLIANAADREAMAVMRERRLTERHHGNRRTYVIRKLAEYFGGRRHTPRVQLKPSDLAVC